MAKERLMEKVCIRLPQYVLNGMEAEQQEKGYAHRIEAARQVLCKHYRNYRFKKLEK